MTAVRVAAERERDDRADRTCGEISAGQVFACGGFASESKYVKIDAEVSRFVDVWLKMLAAAGVEEEAEEEAEKEEDPEEGAPPPVLAGERICCIWERARRV